MTGNLRKQMLEEDHRRAFQKMQSSDDRTAISFTETWANGSRINTRTATVTILAGGDIEKAMEFLKHAVRDEPPFRIPTA